MPTVREASAALSPNVPPGTLSGACAQVGDGSPRMWKIVGGTKRGGLLVRERKDLSSLQLPSRLSTGAAVEEIELDGDHLRYRRVAGSGPDEGWITIRFGKDMLAFENVKGVMSDARGDEANTTDVGRCFRGRCFLHKDRRGEPTAQEVFPNLFLGNMAAATDGAEQQRLGNKHIINATSHVTASTGARVLKLGLKDADGDQDISLYFNPCIKFIEDAHVAGGASGAGPLRSWSLEERRANCRVPHRTWWCWAAGGPGAHEARAASSEAAAWFPQAVGSLREGESEERADPETAAENGIRRGGLNLR